MPSKSIIFIDIACQTHSDTNGYVMWEVLKCVRMTKIVYVLFGGSKNTSHIALLGNGQTIARRYQVAVPTKFVEISFIKCRWRQIMDTVCSSQSKCSIHSHFCPGAFKGSCIVAGYVESGSALEGRGCCCFSVVLRQLSSKLWTGLSIQK